MAEEDRSEWLEMLHNLAMWLEMLHNLATWLDMLHKLAMWLDMLQFSQLTRCVTHLTRIDTQFSQCLDLLHKK